MIKNYLLPAIYCCLFLAAVSFCSAQTPGEWTWIKGSNAPGSTGSYGTKGVASPTNTPPATYEANNFIDKQGNIWTFGGVYQGSGVDDLWKYDPVTNEWTWIEGKTYLVTYDPGNFGVKTVPAASNYPPGIGYCAATWTDTTGDFWIFGGRVGGGLTNALWRYNIATNMWTWMTGSSLANGTAVYGTMGVPSPLNTPGNKQETNACWTDDNNNLWLYGGLSSGVYSDLWKYDISTNQWTWMQGSQLSGVVPVYGVKGVSASTNTPGGRWVYSKWKDANNNFWLYGGEGNGGYFSDLWKYTISTNEWTWMSGSTAGNDVGLFVSQCNPSTYRYPGARWENRACWTDACHTFWLFGSGMNGNGGHNDLWNFNPVNNEWKWVSGDSTTGQAPVYGTLNVSAPTNKPGSRFGPIGWTDSQGYMYVFAGTTNYSDYYNDIFRYVLDSSCAITCSTGLVALFTVSDTTFCTESGECVNFFDHSTGGPTTWQWSFPGGNPSSSTAQNPINICYYNPGTYPVTLIVTNSNGTDTLNVNPLIIFGTPPPPPSIAVINGDTLITAHGSSYQWYYNGFPIAGANDSIYVVTQTGTYAVLITDGIGCSAISSGIFVTSIESPNHDAYEMVSYPNPANDQLIVSLKGKLGTAALLSNNVTFIVYDRVGQLVPASYDLNGDHCNLNLSGLSNGIYMLQVAIGSSVVNGKFVVIHK